MFTGSLNEMWSIMMERTCNRVNGCLFHFLKFLVIISRAFLAVEIVLVFANLPHGFVFSTVCQTGATFIYNPWKIRVKLS